MMMGRIALGIMFAGCIIAGAMLASHGLDVPLWLGFFGAILFIGVIFD